jgi:hypothetical protein
MRVDYQTILTLSVTAFIAILGWLIAHTLSLRQNRVEKQRELRISFLTQAYRDLVELANEGISGSFDIKRLRRIITDIYLFGTKHQHEQLDLLKKGNLDLSEQPINLGDLIGDLRDQLRSDLGLPLVAKGHYFSIKWIGNPDPIGESKSIRINYLINAYQIFKKAEIIGLENTNKDDLYIALANLSLFGNSDQLRRQRNFVRTFEKGDYKNNPEVLDELNSELIELLDSICKEIRVNVGL